MSLRYFVMCSENKIVTLTFNFLLDLKLIFCKKKYFSASCKVFKTELNYISWFLEICPVQAEKL